MADQTAVPAETASMATSSSAPPETAESPTEERLHRQLRSATHQEYLDSLVVPSGDELARIAEVQASREEQLKQRSRGLQRRRHSLDLGSVPSMPAAIEDGSGSTAPAVPPPAAPAPRRKPSLAQRLGLARGLDSLARTQAAIVIQRHYRGYRTRREMDGRCLDADTRWVQALRELQYRQQTRPRPRVQRNGDSDGGPRPGTAASAPAATMADTDSTCSTVHQPSAARRNWKKATTVALRAGLDPDSDSDSDSDADADADADLSDAPEADRRKPATAEDRRLARRHRDEARARRRREARTMGLQYFLEMVDPRHRYGANLRVYHEEWQRAGTQDNFFFWLDRGEGRLVDMAACPRGRLEREQVRYLSREERQYYLVRIDRDGRLCWAKNGARIDTSGQYHDSIHGIVPADDPTPAYQSAAGGSADGDELDRRASSSELEAARAAKYALGLGPDLDLDLDLDHAPDGATQAGTVRKVRHVSATALLDALLRKSVQKNTWIFVADTSFRLYVGIKDSGTFQHSSFLQGSRISAAGLIRIRDGRLESLSPLSGHYRPPTANFRAFVHSLKEAGVDTGHVTFSKSYAALLGLETYMATRQRGKSLLQRLAASVGGDAATKKNGPDGSTDGHLLPKPDLELRPSPGPTASRGIS